MIVSLALMLASSGASPATNAEIAFRQCVLKQARALNSREYPSYAVAKRFAENCHGELKALPASEQRKLTREYACAVSAFRPPCPKVTD